MFKNHEFAFRVRKIKNQQIDDSIDLETPPTIEERVAYAMHFVKPVVTRIAIAVCCVIACDTVREVVIANFTPMVES